MDDHVPSWYYQATKAPAFQNFHTLSYVKGDAYPVSILKLQNCECHTVLLHSQVLPLLIFLIRLNV